MNKELRRRWFFSYGQTAIEINNQFHIKVQKENSQVFPIQM